MTLSVMLIDDHPVVRRPGEEAALWRDRRAHLRRPFTA